MSHTQTLSGAITVPQFEHVSKRDPLPEDLIPEDHGWTTFESTFAVIGAVVGILVVGMLASVPFLS